MSDKSWTPGLRWLWRAGRNYNGIRPELVFRSPRCIANAKQQSADRLRRKRCVRYEEQRRASSLGVEYESMGVCRLRPPRRPTFSKKRRELLIGMMLKLRTYNRSAG